MTSEGNKPTYLNNLYHYCLLYESTTFYVSSLLRYVVLNQQQQSHQLTLGLIAGFGPARGAGLESRAPICNSRLRVAKLALGKDGPGKRNQDAEGWERWVGLAKGALSA